jgi:uncharacterized membrane protein YphA (DoxX/SURF4 family)
MLSRIYDKISQNPLLKRFTIFNRIVLAIAFLPSGFEKLINERFTQISIEHPIGFFFEAFYQNELWYRTVGLVQITASILLLIPKTAHLGAFIFLPIILNINLITFGLQFKGTPVITLLMLLSNLYLIAWEYPYWKTWFEKPQTASLNYRSTFTKTEIRLFIISLFILIIFVTYYYLK